MTVEVRQFLDTFEALPVCQRHEAAVEILRRAGVDGDVPESALVELADGLFQAMDANEERHAAS